MTALTVDPVLWFIQSLQDVEARIGARTPADPNGTLDWLPFVQVIRAGGPDDGLVLDIPTMAFHAYAPTQQAANDLLMTVRNTVYDLRGVPGHGAVITYARTLSGPSWAATTNQNVAHAVLLMQARIKAV